MQTTVGTITIFTLSRVTARVPSFLRITDKFGDISYSHFFSSLAINSGQLEPLEALYFLFHLAAFSLK